MCYGAEERTTIGAPRRLAVRNYADGRDDGKVELGPQDSVLSFAVDERTAAVAAPARNHLAE